MTANRYFRDKKSKSHGEWMWDGERMVIRGPSGGWVHSVCSIDDLQDGGMIETDESGVPLAMNTPKEQAQLKREAAAKLLAEAEELESGVKS